MPASLKEDGDTLLLKLGGDKDEFQRQKAAAKTIAGYRWDPERKVWVYRNDADTLLALAQRVEPDIPRALQDRIRAAAAEKAEELVTKLPDDAQLSVPWADKLAPKQRAGVEFMVNQQRVILADEMGAGKTVESITTVYEDYLQRSEPDTNESEDYKAPPPPRVLVICPNAVTGHWQREIDKWAAVGATIIKGGPKQRGSELAMSETWTIINWEKLPLMLDELKKVEWDAIIADEAHYAKSYNAQRSKALRKLHAPIEIAATGTPIMNHPGELWPLLAWLVPEQYTSFWGFFYTYCEFFQNARGQKTITGVKNPDALRFELADKLVRRTKREMHPSIPKPFDPIVYEPEMRPEQAKLYESALVDFWVDVGKAFLKDADGVQDFGEAKDEFMKLMERGDDLLAIPNGGARSLRLRQIATSPALVGGPDVSGKLDEIERIVDAGGQERPWVWFTWFRDSSRLLVDRFQAMGIDAQGFSGDDTLETRQELTDSFQAGEFQIIVPTIASGGVGIEFFRAADCGFAEEHWVPGINEQAFGRVDRKGQTVRPQRHNVRTPGTVEVNRIVPKNATKTLIVETIMGGS